MTKMASREVLQELTCWRGQSTPWVDRFINEKFMVYKKLMAEHGEVIEEKNAKYSHYFDEVQEGFEVGMGQERVSCAQELPLGGAVCLVVVDGVPLRVWQSLLLEQ